MAHSIDGVLQPRSNEQKEHSARITVVEPNQVFHSLERPLQNSICQPHLSGAFIVGINTVN